LAHHSHQIKKYLSTSGVQVNGILLPPKHLNPVFISHICLFIKTLSSSIYIIVTKGRIAIRYAYPCPLNDFQSQSLIGVSVFLGNWVPLGTEMLNPFLFLFKIMFICDFFAIKNTDELIIPNPSYSMFQKKLLRDFCIISVSLIFCFPFIIFANV